MTNPYAPPPGEGGGPSRSGSEMRFGVADIPPRKPKTHKPARRWSVNRVQTPELNDEQRYRFLRSRRNTRLMVFAALFIPLILLTYWGITHTGVWMSTNNGVSETAEGNYREAMEEFEQALDYDVDTQKERQLYNVGTTYLNQQNYTSAIDYLNEALTVDPGNDADFTCKAYINLVHSYTGSGQMLAKLGNDYAGDAIALEEEISAGKELEDGELTPEDYRNLADSYFGDAADQFGLAQETIPLRRMACDEADPPQSQQEQEQRDQDQEQELEDLENQRREAEENMSEPPERGEEGGEDEMTEEERRQQELEERNNEAQQNREDEQESQNGGGDDEPDWDDGDEDDDGEDDDGDDDGEGGSDRTPQW